MLGDCMGHMKVLRTRLHILTYRVDSGHHGGLCSALVPGIPKHKATVSATGEIDGF